MIPAEAVEAHYPEPRPCGDYLCDQDHDGPCWTCGEPWPCTGHKGAYKVRYIEDGKNR